MNEIIENTDNIVSGKKIVKIMKKQGFNNCIIIFDDDTYQKVNLDLIFKYGLNKDKLIPFQTLSHVEEEQSIIDAKQAAYNYAAYKPRTEKQIITKLTEKHFSDKVIQIVIDFLKQFNLIDDEKFAASFIKSVLVKKNVGIRKAEIELIKRGVDKNLALKSLDEYYPYNLTKELAIKAAEKKLRIYEKYPIPKRKQLMFGHLMRNGFDQSTIKHVIDELYKN